MIPKLLEMSRFNFSLEKLPTYNQLCAYVKEEDKNAPIHIAITSLLQTTNPNQEVVREIVENIISGIQYLKEIYRDTADNKLTEIANSIEGFNCYETERQLTNNQVKYNFDSVEIQVRQPTNITFDETDNSLSTFIKDRILSEDTVPIERSLSKIVNKLDDKQKYD